MVGFTRLVSMAPGLFLLAGLAMAQTESQGEPAPAVAAPAQPAPAIPEDKRIFGVLPNYRTTEASNPFVPLTARQKFTIAVKDSFDWPVYPTSAAFAALYQLDRKSVV